MKKIKVYIDVFGKVVELVIGDYGDMARYVQKEFGLEVEPFNSELYNAFTIKILSAKRTCLIWMPKFRKHRTDDLSTLVHECVHAAEIIIELCGLEGGNDHELEAYLISHLYSGFLKELQ